MVVEIGEEISDAGAIQAMLREDFELRKFVEQLRKFRILEFGGRKIELKEIIEVEPKLQEKPEKAKEEKIEKKPGRKKKSNGEKLWQQKYRPKIPEGTVEDRHKILMEMEGEFTIEEFRKKVSEEMQDISMPTARNIVVSARSNGDVEDTGSKRVREDGKRAHHLFRVVSKPAAEIAKEVEEEVV